MEVEVEVEVDEVSEVGASVRSGGGSEAGDSDAISRFLTESIEQSPSPTPTEIRSAMAIMAEIERAANGGVGGDGSGGGGGRDGGGDGGGGLETLQLREEGEGAAEGEVFEWGRRGSPAETGVEDITDTIAEWIAWEAGGSVGPAPGELLLEGDSTSEGGASKPEMNSPDAAAAPNGDGDGDAGDDGDAEFPAPMGVLTVQTPRMGSLIGCVGSSAWPLAYDPDFHDTLSNDGDDEHSARGGNDKSASTPSPAGAESSASEQHRDSEGTDAYDEWGYIPSWADQDVVYFQDRCAWHDAPGEVSAAGAPAVMNTTLKSANNSCTDLHKRLLELTHRPHTPKSQPSPGLY